MNKPNETWINAVSEKSKQEPSLVQSTLERYSVPGRRAMVSRRKLRLEGVHFAGIKSVARLDDLAVTDDVPFSFTHRYDHRVTAFATVSRNLAGKTSIVNVTEWGLRGTSKRLQRDVRGWIRQAAVGFSIAGEHLLVGWVMTDGQPQGRVLGLPPEVTFDWSNADSALSSLASEAPVPMSDWLGALISQGAEPLAEFDSDLSFKAAMSAVMGPRIGFDNISTWQGNPNAVDAEDGKLVAQDWPLWSQALVISDPDKIVTLGEVQGSAPAVLQMYLGTPWGMTAAVASAQKKALHADLSGRRRRAKSDDEASQKIATVLSDELEALESELSKLPEVDSVDRIRAQVENTRQAAEELVNAEQALAEATATWSSFEKQVEAAEADLEAIQEAVNTRRFWHAFSPTCCPRCDATVGAQQLRREKQGHCSLCDSELKNEPVVVEVPVEDPEDQEPDDLTAAEDLITTLRIERDEASTVHDLALARRNELRTAVEEAAKQVSVDDHSDRRRELEIGIARLRGRMDERTGLKTEDPDLSRLERDYNIVNAAFDVANEWKLNDQRELLEDVNRQITDIARRLGVPQIRSAAFKSNANLTIDKGGAKDAPFGELPGGEQLRLKIAIVIALLRVGGASGVNRHPGVIFIDSFAREEMNPEDVVSTLSALQAVAEEFDVQVVTSSANGHRIEKVLPAGAVRLPQAADDFMW